MPRLAPIVLPIADALNCICAETVVASRAVPAFDTCAIDGFAVCADDVGELRIIDEVPAGFVSDRELTAGSAIRVAAGTMLPVGATGVLPWNGQVGTVTLSAPVLAGSGVIATGSQIGDGDVVCHTQSVIDAPAIARLASSGHHTVLVHPRPRVVIIPVGTELARTGESVRAGIVNDATGPMLLAETRLNQADAYLADPVPDVDDDVLAAIEEAQLRADVIVTTGGLGVLEGGAVARTLNTAGGLSAFNEIPVVALAGDPSAALAGFQAIASPKIQELRGF